MLNTMIQSALLFLRRATYIVCHAIMDTVNHSGVEYAGYIAFLTILSVFPFLIFTTSLITTIATTLNLSDDIASLTLSLIEDLPDSITAGIKPRITEIMSGPPMSLITLALGNILWTSSSIIEGLRTVLNIAARVNVAPPYILRRLLSIVQFVLVSLFLTFSMFFIAAIPLINKAMEDIMSVTINLNLKYIGTFTLLCTMMWLYRVLPNRRQNFYAIFSGSLVVIFLWVVSAKLFVIFLKSFSHLSIIYGSLGSVIVVLLFFYILALCVIFGAELIYYIEFWINGWQTTNNHRHGLKWRVS